MNTFDPTPLPAKTHYFKNGASLKIVRNRHAPGGQPIIASAVLNRGPWPLEALGVMLAEFQAHADQERVSFNQTVTLPDGLELRFAFAPGVPFVAVPLPGSPPPPFDPDQARADCLAALRRRFTPEMLAESLASLPAASQLEFARKFLIEPPVRRTLKIIIRKPRAKKTRP